MGEARKEALRVDFDRSVKLEFHGSTISSDGGLLAYRELDEAFALTAMAEDVLTDLRTGSNIQHSLTGLLRQSIYSRLAGYDDTNDAERLGVDPVMRQVVGGRAVRHTARPPARWPASRPKCLPSRRTCRRCWLWRASGSMASAWLSRSRS